jgi:outer membrane protein TolC
MRYIHKLCVTYSLLLASLLFAGCAVGPNFNKPAAPNVAGYLPTAPSTTTNVPNVSGGEAQQFVQSRDIPGDWWTLFHSAALNDLIERALKANPDLKASQAALVVARENMLAQRGAYYPTVSAGFTFSGA